MVDFDNETTISTPSYEIVKVLILQRRSYLIDIYEEYLKREYQGQESQTQYQIIRARLHSLFLELQPLLKRKLKPAEYNELYTRVRSDNPEQVEQAMFKINEFIDEIKITAIDTKQHYDRTRVENENRMKGL